MVSQFIPGSTILKSLRTMISSVVSRAISSLFTTGAVALMPISIGINPAIAATPINAPTFTTKTQFLAQFPHHTSASSALGFLVTNYSIYCQATEYLEVLDASAIKPLCGGVGDGEISPQFTVDNTLSPATVRLEPVVLFQDDKVVVLRGDL
jgi:hypothetical protein